jgi:HEAT repeat protein
LANAGVDVTSLVEDPVFSEIWRYYVGLAPAAPVIERVLGGPDDLFLNRLWKAASLLAAAPVANAPWRAELIKRLAQLFLNPRVPALFRERSLYALVASGEPGIVRLFTQAARHGDPSVRAGAILGLGAVGNKEILPLIENALSDEVEHVRLAAVDAASVLARMGVESALELIITSIIEAEDYVQRVAAELLADLGAEGQAVLREGAMDHDLIVRRASVYGLSTINEPWARDLLEKVQHEDEEWLVRNAAAEALASLNQQADRTVELALPQVDTEPWLVTWAAEQGIGTGTGEAALTTLMRALAEGEPHVRYSAVETLRRIADPHTIGQLRHTLRTPDPRLRDTALLALNEITQRHDMTITTG